MSSDRATFAFRIALSAATAILILAGATLNVSGRTGQAALLATFAGLLAVLAGALFRVWKGAAPRGGAAPAASALTPPSGFVDLPALLLLGFRAAAASRAYT